MLFRSRLIHLSHEEGCACIEDALLRVKKPAQKPRTAPRTIANCSRAMREPRTSGGLISAMYNGESMLQGDGVDELRA